MIKENNRFFWAEIIADEIESRESKDTIIIKGAVSPSGAPHLGHLNEIMRGYYVAEILRDRGHKVRQIFTSDDKDALRKVPKFFIDENWDIIGIDEIDAGLLWKNLGVPYSDIQNPFNSGYESYGDHFTALLRESTEMIGVPVEFISTTKMYEEGKFDESIREIFEKRELSEIILKKYQDNVSDGYIPFVPQCEICNKLTAGVKNIDMEREVVAYKCTGFLDASGKLISGCGHEGHASFREGKLPWRFEWPAEWKVLNVDFEPFGKDHAEGSWPSGKEIAQEIFGMEPPVPMVYEWFTLGGKSLSSSNGNIITVKEISKLIEPEILRYFFAKNPNKQRDLDLSKMDRLVDEFDEFEMSYFEGDGKDKNSVVPSQIYPAIIKETVEKLEGVKSIEEFRSRQRIPYRSSAVLGMVNNEKIQKEMASHQGYIDLELPKWTVDLAIERIKKGRYWAESNQNEYNYYVKETMPDIDIKEDFKIALRELADYIELGKGGAEIQEKIYGISKDNAIEMSEFFKVNYELFFAQEKGPRLGPLLSALDRKFVCERLRMER